MVQELHISIPHNGRILEADVEVVAQPEGRAWDFQTFTFTDLFLSETSGEGEFLDTMPEDAREAAEDEAEREFLKLDL